MGGSGGEHFVEVILQFDLFVLHYLSDTSYHTHLQMRFLIHY